MIMAVSSMCFVTPVGAAWNENYEYSEDVGERIARIAYAQFGKSGTELGYSVPWCAYFVWDCAKRAGVLESEEFRYTGLAYSWYFFGNDHYKEYRIEPEEAKNGDLVFLGNDQGHVGIYYNGTVIDGNNGTDNNSANNHVNQNSCSKLNSIFGKAEYYRPHYITYETMTNSEYSSTLTDNNTGHVYAYYLYQTTWSQAKQKCESFGGHLATITSAEEQGIVAGLASKAGKALWIGATRDSSNTYSDFGWITGESFGYTNWNSNEPSRIWKGVQENCVAIYASGKWNDLADNSGTPKGFICEWDDGNTSGDNAVYATSVSDLNGEFYIIPSYNTGKAIDIYAQKKEAQAIAHLWDFHGGDSQKFKVTHVGDYIVLTNVNSNKSLDVKWGSRDSGAQVWQWGTHNGNSQKWLPTYCGDGTFELKSALGNYLDANGGNSDNGTKILVWTGNGTAAQKWKFRYVNAPCSHSYSYGNDSAHPHNRYKTCTKCGEKSYTGETGYDSSCSTCNPVHIHSWVTGTEKAHPHRNYKYCDECGEKTYTDDGNYRSSCDECNPDTECVHNWNYYNKSSHPHKEYRECSKCGEVEYTGNTGYESSCSKCNVCNHSWNYYNESAHPHKEYKECSKCGETKYTGATGSVDSCGKCHPVTDSEMTRPCEHNWKYYTESSHPHKEYKMCTSCGDEVYTGATEYKSNCSICNPPDERYWRDWSEWSTSYVESSETRQVQTKTQYVYCHYLLTYDDNNVGTYPMNMATANYNFRNFVNAHVKAESYHEYYSDSPLSAITTNRYTWIENGQRQIVDKYPNMCTQDSGNFGGNANNLYYKGTRTLYRYRDFK